jgi:hypothetical protein
VIFGLGTSAQISNITIAWPSGQRQTVRGLAIDRYHKIVEPH